MLPSLLEAPAETDTQSITPLASLVAYDAVLNDDYAFVAYKETDRATGTWRVRIRARHLAGVVFEPEAMRLQARAAAAQGNAFFTWGNGIDPSPGDPRRLHYRVHVRDAKPASIKIDIQLRKADHSPDAPKSVEFAWPQ